MSKAQQTGPASFDVEDMTANWHIDPADYSPVVSQSRWRSLRYALSGWLYMFRFQKNVRLQLVATILVVLMGLWLGVSRIEWAILTITITFNWMAEILNAAIEAAVNLASQELHPMAKVSKDVAASAALLAAGSSVIVGLLILGPPLLLRLQGG